MKKKVPNIINIEIPDDALFFERCVILIIESNIEKGYAITKYDFDRYCAVLCKNLGLESLPEAYRNYCYKDGKLKDRIRYNIIRFSKESQSNISSDDHLFYKNYLREKINYRKTYIKKEINRTGVNGIKHINSSSYYYRNLLRIVSQIEDEITLIQGYIPVKLSFEKLVHIYIKHAEETKFGDGAFKKRTFFEYDFDHIWTLLNSVLKQETQNILDHFMEVYIGKLLKENDKIRDYHRGFRKFSDIEFNGDLFALSIKHNGYIEKFHQL